MKDSSNSSNDSKQNEKSKYRHLFSLAMADVTSAVFAAAGVSPFVTIIDRSIVRNANGSKPLSVGLKEGFAELLVRPHRFVRGRDFRIVWFVYSGTYIASNLTTLMWDREKYLPPKLRKLNPTGTGAHLTELPNLTSARTKEQRSWIDGKPIISAFEKMSSELPKFVFTTAANITLCVRKDIIFATMFGLRGVNNPPLMSYSLFIIRDMLTVAAAFNLPGYISPWLMQFQQKRSKAHRQTNTEAEVSNKGVQTHNGDKTTTLNTAATKGAIIHSLDSDESATPKLSSSPSSSSLSCSSPITSSNVGDDKGENIAPEIATEEIEKNTNVSAQGTTNVTEAEEAAMKRWADNGAQFLCPVSVQLFSTIIHLLGLDVYNRPDATASQRMGLIRRQYLGSVAARMARITPAFGIGGIANREIREKLHNAINKSYYGV
eukprot:Selendium_serpulae@DN5207_c1_g1_i1.p1